LCGDVFLKISKGWCEVLIYKNAVSRELFHVKLDTVWPVDLRYSELEWEVTLLF